GAVRGGVTGVRIVHGGADSPHHLRADDGVAAAHPRRRRRLPGGAARALVGAGGGGDGDGAGVRGAAAGAVRGARRRWLRGGGAERGSWFGAFNHWEMAGWYAGALTVLLAPLGLARRRPELWALGAVALLGVLLAFGDHAPVHRFFFRYVPLYGALRCPTRAL